MESRYISSTETPDYDQRISDALTELFPDNDDEENWLSGSLHDYRMGIEDRTGQVYREVGLSLIEGVTLHDRLHDLGLRDQAGELEGSRNGYHWLMRPTDES